MRTTAVAAASLHAIPAYAESLRVSRSLGFTDAESGARAGQNPFSQSSPFGTDRFVRGEVPESERDPGLAAYLRAGKTALGATSGAEADLETAREVNRLRARDQAVRAHEAAHIAAGGSHIRGAASYSYETGPDGKQYAVGGEVSIDVSPVAGNPQATITKMTAVRAAALAPGEPSAADIAVANAAAQAIAEAQVELRETRVAGADSPNESDSPATSTATDRERERGGETETLPQARS